MHVTILEMSLAAEIFCVGEPEFCAFYQINDLAAKGKSQGN